MPTGQWKKSYVTVPTASQIQTSIIENIPWYLYILLVRGSLVSLVVFTFHRLGRTDLQVTYISMIDCFLSSLPVFALRGINIWDLNFLCRHYMPSNWQWLTMFVCVIMWGWVTKPFTSCLLVAYMVLIIFEKYPFWFSRSAQ